MPKQASSNGTADLDRGRKIGKYEILTRLSVGGMAELFLAFTSGPGGFRKFVALKQILPDVKTEEFVKMFLDEARITAAFSHPNIGQVFDLGLEDDELYLAMEFLPGQNLEHVMMAASYVRPLPIGFAARVARDVCLGLHYAHNFTAPSGRKVAVVHRDMAPRNVMITYDGVVKVIDFGIAKAKGRIARTRVGMVKGTSGYMSPEQVRGQDLDGRSDLFTAGVLLHEMLCGQRLFDTNDEDAMMRQIASAEIAPPRANNPDVPEALDAVVMRALAKDPAKRFATGREMAKAIEAAAGSVLFDEEAVAELMQALFADKRLKTLALLDYASHDDERVSKVVEALQDEKTMDGTVEAVELDDIRPTAPMMALPPQQEASRPSPTPTPSRSGTPGARPLNPPKARPFPAAPPRKSSGPPNRKAPLPLEEDAPTQIGPVPGMSERSAAGEPETRESRRSPKMGMFTLGATESQAHAGARPREDEGETSEVSQVSRVSRAWGAVRPPARRGLWFVLAIVVLGFAVLLMPESLRSRLGALFSSAGHWVSERLSSPAPQPAPDTPAPVQGSGTVEPSPDAYEPPPPAEGTAAEEPAERASPPPTPPVVAPRTRTQEPSNTKPSEAAVEPEETVADPGETAVEETLAPSQRGPAATRTPRGRYPRTGKVPASQAKPVVPAPTEPVEEAPALEEPSKGPAEIDPSIQPLELAPPATDSEQQ
jgi:serine/threonine-protein kinase